MPDDELFAFAPPKLARINNPHVKPLNDYVRRIAIAAGYNQDGPVPEVPYFDPDDGGVDARVLFIMDTPIVKADVGRASGLISMENPDATASYILATHEEFGLPREPCAFWNIVTLPTETRPSTPEERSAGVDHTKEILSKFDHLELIVLMGKKAQAGWHHMFPRDDYPVPVESVFLPSNRTNRNAEYTEPYRALIRDLAVRARSGQPLK